MTCERRPARQLSENVVVFRCGGSGPNVWGSPENALKQGLSPRFSVITGYMVEKSQDSDSAAGFDHWSLDRQLGYLEQNLRAETFADLILLCAGLADTTPLLSLVRRGQDLGLSLDASHGELLLQLSTSALQKLLELPNLGLAVKAAWTRAEVGQLVSFALLDRYLRRRHPKTWRQCLDKVATLSEERLQSQGEPDERLILRLEGRQQKRLKKLFPESWPRWSQAWTESSKQAIHHLAARPRGVSLANAERLLSQQVYTDQGHFLLELLQNADDAGADEFEVRFEESAITVSHNGDPFDFRDLVGVLSIGQTTKTERQIGYFGVGFKSVFEVTERPRIYSGHFAFEIVEISIPRFLMQQEYSPEKTVLVLPLKDGLEVQPYYQRALGIQSTLLLNLPNVRTLRWIGPDGNQTILSQSQQGMSFTLSRGDEAEQYLVWRGDYEHQGFRPEGKPRSTHLMLAFPQSYHNQIPEQNLFSFLPIQENSGLRFLVGSHFDVPVDRERLDQTSAWNQGILRNVAPLIVKHCLENPERVLGLLKRLPLPTDPVSPMFKTIGPSLVEGLTRLPFIPGDEGWKKPAAARILEEELGPLFRPEEMRDYLEPEDSRTAEWLKLLGARSYDLKALLLDLTRGKAPKLLEQRDVEVWVHFHKLLLQSPSFEVWEKQLRQVPLFPSDSGSIESADALCEIPEEWKGVFKHSPPTVWSELLEIPETQALLASLQVKLLTWQDLLKDLSTHGLEAFHFKALVELFCQAPKSAQFAFLRLPLFRNQRGQLTALAPAASPLEGALVPASQLPQELFPHLDFCSDPEPLRPLFEASDWKCFGRSQAIAYLYLRQWAPTPEEAEIFATWLIQGKSELATLEDSERLARLQIFESDEGALRSLKELWVYEDQELASLLPDLPQLKKGSLSERLVHHFSLQHLLGQAGLSTLIERFNSQDPGEILDVLSQRAHSLSRNQISKLLSQPLIGGRPVAHSDAPFLSDPVEVAEPEYIPLFLDLGLEVAGVEDTRRLLPLLRAAGYEPFGHKHLLQRLTERKPTTEMLPSLQALLQEKGPELCYAYSEQILRGLPVWKCADGEIRSLLEIPPDEDTAALLEMTHQQLAEDQSLQLLHFITPLEPLEFLVEQLRDQVRVNRPLSEQPPWFNTVRKVDAVAQRLAKHIVCVDRQERVRDQTLLYAPVESYLWLCDLYGGELLHPESSRSQQQRAVAVEHHDIVEQALPRFDEIEVREAFYSYLSGHLSEVVRDESARLILLTQAIWLTGDGAWRCLDELILEPGFPDLGYDWYPHPEIPEELLEKLRVALEVGRPEPETLFATLLPDYRERVKNHEEPSELLALMARIAEPLSNNQLRALVSEAYPQEEFPLLHQGRPIPISSAYAPPVELSALPSVTPQPAEQVPFLRKLGLPYLPAPECLGKIEGFTSEDGERLVALVEWVWSERSDELEGHFEFLSGWTWMRAKSGELKAPVQLYTPTHEVEELIGTAPDLYPEHFLPLNLWRKLGVKGEDEVALPEALTYLKSRIELAQKVGSRFYDFLERTLERGRAAPTFLRSSLDSLNWIWTDEAEYRNHREVIGFPAYRYFGSFRGTWELAHKRFPRLTRFFEVPESLNPVVVETFLREVASGKAPDCPTRLLTNCLAYLGEREASIPREWQVLPARHFPTLEEQLVSAARPGVVRSNSPTLASLFGQGGELWVVETDHPEHGEALELLYQRMGIPRLRDTYTVHPDQSGVDVTAKMAEQVSQFRALLRAVDRVLPRLRAARPDWGEGEWLAQSQLRPFATTASIRVIDGLQLIYQLGNISRVRVQAAIAYDPEGKRLLVSSEAVSQPQAYAAELAEGLVDCIYQGPGSESLVDLLNLLLFYGSEDQMNAYLDLRHFPKPFDEHVGPREPWRERLGEILDFSLYRALERYFPELESARWERWRDPSWTPQEESAENFLAQIGIHNPSAELLEAFTEMMEGAQLRMPSQETQVVVVSEAASAGADEAESPQSGPKTSGLFGNLRKALANKLSEFVSPKGELEPGIRLKTETVDLADTYQHPPEKHLLFSESDLCGHSRYCLHLLCSNFDHATQQYKPGWNAWNPLFVPSGQTVQFSGSLTMATLPLAMPLYSRMIGPPRLEGEGDVVGPDAFQHYRLEPATNQALLTYDVELSAAPDYKNSVALENVDPRLLSTSVLLHHLPSDLRQWVDWARSSASPHWQLADRANELIRASYEYNLDYLSAEAVKALIARPVEPGENRFLSILHAEQSGSFLGRGTCSELSAILMEVLRHCGVPCALARVWMLDQGLIHVPDHAIVLAMVPSDHGPYWLPLDPSSSRVTPGNRSPEKLVTRLELLEKAANLLLPGMTGLPRSEDRRQRFLQDRLLGLFGHSGLLELYLECLARPGRIRKDLTPDLQELATRGFLKIDNQNVFQVWVAGLADQ